MSCPSSNVKQPLALVGPQAAQPPRRGDVELLHDLPRAHLADLGHRLQHRGDLGLADDLVGLREAQHLGQVDLAVLELLLELRADPPGLRRLLQRCTPCLVGELRHHETAQLLERATAGRAASLRTPPGRVNPPGGSAPALLDAERAGELACRLDVALGAPARQRFEQLQRRHRVGERRGADATAVAPASMNSTTSSTVRTPPMPMIGTSGSAWCTWWIARTATGLIAGPDRPPVTAASLRPARLDVDRHAQQRVDHADAGGAGGDRGLGDRGDVGDVGCELGEDRHGGDAGRPG